MKLHILSDLHMEIFAYNIQVLDTDVIILAGDIGDGTKGLEWAANLLDSTNAHIIYLAGNHEFYYHELNEMRSKMQAFCKQHHRLHYLENNEVIIDNVRFLGATLWTDFNLIEPESKQTAIRMGELSLTDFRLIKFHDYRLTVQDAINMHQHTVKFLDTKLDEGFTGKTVIITHHAPSLKSVAPKYQDGFMRAYFASKLDKLLGRSDLWIHGHTHVSSDYHVGKTRVICNPRGRPLSETESENKNFNPRLIIEI